MNDFDPATLALLQEQLRRVSRRHTTAATALSASQEHVPTGYTKWLRERFETDTRVLADLERLVSLVEADNTVEAFVDVADAERTAQRDEYVNRTVRDFRRGDMVNVCEPGHKHFGVRGSIVGFVYDPLEAVVEYDNFGSTFTVPESSLMHYGDFVAQPQEYFDAAEADDVAQIEHDMAIEAGDDHDPETCPWCAPRTTLAEQLRAARAGQAACDAEDDAFHAERSAAERESADAMHEAWSRSDDDADRRAYDGESGV